MMAQDVIGLNDGTARIAGVEIPAWVSRGRRQNTVVQGRAYQQLRRLCLIRHAWNTGTYNMVRVRKRYLPSGA